MRACQLPQQPSEGVLASRVEPQLLERGYGNASLAAIELLVTTIATTLRSTEAERDSAYEQLMAIYRDHDHTVEGHGPHTSLYEAGAKAFHASFSAVKTEAETRARVAADGHDEDEEWAAADVLPASAEDIASFVASAVGLDRLATALDASMITADALSAELECIGHARALCDVRLTNHDAIIKLDQDLHRYFTESTGTPVGR